MAVCKVGEGVNAIKPKPVLTMNFSSIGKHPHITLSDESIDFGDILVDCADYTQIKKEVVLKNHGVVPATFEIKRRENDCDNVFDVSPMCGCVPPKDEVTIKIIYSARTFGTFSIDNYDFFTPGGNTISLQCAGRAVSPMVSLKKKEDPFHPGVGVTNSINFRDVHVGESI